MVGGSEKASEKRSNLGRELREQGLPYSSRLGAAGPAGTRCTVRSSSLLREDPVMLPFTKERLPLSLDLRSQNLSLR